MLVQRGEKLHLPLNPNGLGVEIFTALKRHQIDGANVAIVNGETKECITYRSLFHSSIQLAKALSQQCSQDSIIGLICENHVNFFTPVLAAFFLGIPITTISYRYKAVELVHVLSLTKPKVVFTSSTSLPSLLQVLPKCPWTKTIILIDCDYPNEQFAGLTTIHQLTASYYDSREFSPVSVDATSHAAVVLYSSGTTGAPKGVVLTHQNLLAKAIHIMDPRFNEDVSATRLCVVPFSHASGLLSMTTHLYAGKTVVMLTKYNERTVLQTIQDYKIRTIALVPPVIVALAKSSIVHEYDLSSLRGVYCGAAPLDAATEKEAKDKLGLDYFAQAYGLTEGTQSVLSPPFPIRENKTGSVGKVLPEMEAMIRDLETEKPLPAHQHGELCLKGVLVMKEYWNNPKATADSFTPDGWLRTGDIAYYDEDGYFYIVDRIKELIKYNAWQVSPAELEGILLSHPIIQDAAVVGIVDPDAGELPLAFVVVRKGCNVTADEVKKFVEDRVSSPKRLRGGVRFVEEIPKNPTGKVLRRQLRDSINSSKL